MFVKLGDLINRIWPGLLLGWIGILIFVMTLAPPLWDVVETEEFSALPATSPSLLGEQLFRAAFPKSLVPSRIVIVVRRPDEKLTVSTTTIQSVILNYANACSRLLRTMAAWTPNPMRNSPPVPTGIDVR